MLMFCVKNLSTRFANFDKTWFCGICSNIYWGSISFCPSDHTYMDHMCQTLPFFGNSKIKLANMGVPWNDRRPKLLLDKSLLEWWFNIKQFLGDQCTGASLASAIGLYLRAVGTFDPNLPINVFSLSTTLTIYIILRWWDGGNASQGYEVELE